MIVFQAFFSFIPALRCITRSVSHTAFIVLPSFRWLEHSRASSAFAPTGNNGSSKQQCCFYSSLLFTKLRDANSGEERRIAGEAEERLRKWQGCRECTQGSAPPGSSQGQMGSEQGHMGSELVQENRRTTRASFSAEMGARGRRALGPFPPTLNWVKAALRSEAAFERVKRWTKRLPVFDFDYIFIPIHME